MANVFTKQKNPVNHPKRNVFDLSFQNNLTMQIGGLYPVFCKEVIPGDSFSIKPVFGLRFMPMTFPIQTRMRANLHFFYVRNRNLWQDWQDFIGMNPTSPDENATMQRYVSPYSTNPAITRPQTGSLADYLGIPTTMVGRYGQEGELKRETSWSYRVGETMAPGQDGTVYQLPMCKQSTAFVLNAIASQVNYNGRNIDFLCDTSIFDDFNPIAGGPIAIEGTGGKYSCDPSTRALFTVTASTSFDSEDVVVINESGVQYVEYTTTFFSSSMSGQSENQAIVFALDDNNVILQTIYGTFKPADNQFKFRIPKIYSDKTTRFVMVRVFREEAFTSEYIQYGFPFTGNQVSPVFDYLMPRSLYCDLSGTTVVVGLNNSNSPYGSPDDGLVPISTLPFRAYESIYNCFYRDPRNNPYYINGQAEYNKWCPTTAGGADAQDYPLHFRNWEADFLTTCVQSPQQGRAPLVGMTNYGTLTFADEDGTRYTASLDYSDDGQGVKGINIQASTEPVGVFTRLDDMANYGFTINDLRGVNALQRWLEINMRRGFRYKDQVKSHYDVDIRFDELDMPEFIGGTSCPVNVNMISQTISQGDTGAWQDALGSYAGQGFAVGDSEHAIRHYCDEHGFIIGILSVSPVPNYSQLMPKFFLKRQPLDYYFPEFGHVGMQPVCYDEVCPVQAYNADGKAALRDVFGYQRAWYDYLSSVDEVHGSFRESLRNFLMNRIFENKPELSEDFLLIDPEQVNQVFSVTESTDKILGQVWFDVKAKRPIPEYGIPSLE